jgi:hypothetical protein
MKGSKLLFSILAILLMNVPSFAQGRRLMTNSGGDNTYSLFFETVVEPAEPEMKQIGGGVIVKGKQIHVVMIDAENRGYFGYDVTTEVLPDPSMYRITFGELTADADALRLLSDDAPTYRRLATPDWGGPAVRTIRRGEVLALTLLVNTRTGQKIVDYLTAVKPGEQPRQLGPLPFNRVQEEGMPRDFHADDAWLDVRPESITLDGNSVRTPGRSSGALPFFSIPNQGRFILSLTPQPALGFRKAGEIRGSTINFTINGHTVNLVSSGRIAPGHGPFNLYVLHQPEWSRGGVGTVSPNQLSRQQAK